VSVNENMTYIKNGLPVKARIVLLHGAGAPMDSDFMEQVASLLAGELIEVVRFEFAYMAKRRIDGKKRPPAKATTLIPELQEHLQVLNDDTPMYLVGKSMGGRLSTLVLDESPARCAFVLGYPFHPLGKRDNLRIDHFADAQKPVKIYQGTEDPMGKQIEVSGLTLGEVVHLEWFEAANHDLKPPKRSGFTQEAYLSRICADILDHIQKDAG
jgi:predicted alpha/beta-hydrolase family hydrolase